MTKRLPENILCLCTENTVRSVMLEALLSVHTKVASAGIDPVSFFNPITGEIIKRNDLDFNVEDPKSLDDTDIDAVELVITVSQPAYDYFRDNYKDIPLEFWSTATPPMMGEISREACLESYQCIFDELVTHLQNRFGLTFPRS